MNANLTNWLVMGAALAVTLLVARWLFVRATRRPARRSYKPDVLDEGVAPASRNQALIDAPPAAQVVPPPMSDALGGLGEVVAAAAQEEVTQAPAAPEPVAAPAAADDLARIKGLGPKLQALLPTLGITTFAQIAGLDDAALDALDAKLGAFAGRPRRDGWVEQARLLSAGDVAGFEERFGKV